MVNGNGTGRVVLVVVSVKRKEGEGSSILASRGPKAFQLGKKRQVIRVKTRSTAGTTAFSTHSAGSDTSSRR
jgi:hypothetical protein